MLHACPRLRRDLVGGALLPGEDQVNPMLLAEAFKRSAVRLGATFRPDTRVTALRRRDRHRATRLVELTGLAPPRRGPRNAPRDYRSI